LTTYTDNLRLTLQALGENANTWGDVANNGFVERLEDAIAGFCSVNLTGTGDYTLSVANGAYDEARNMMIRLGGTPGAARNVIIPAASKVYMFECTVSASVSIYIKATGGTGVSVRSGTKNWIYCDGLNTYKVAQTLTDFGITATAGEINILDGATLSTAELNVLDGITATVAELNVLDGITATVAELNVLDGITATVAELNILDGVTATTAEINILDGLTVTTGELNLLDGLTVSAGQINALVSSASAGGVLVAGRLKLQVSSGAAASIVNMAGNIASVAYTGTLNEWRISFVSAYSTITGYTALVCGWESSPNAPYIVSQGTSSVIINGNTGNYNIIIVG